jgi:hypothetical protein
MTWEYLVLPQPDVAEREVQSALDSWGAKGWELVSAVPLPTGWTFFLKRAKR